MTDERGVLVRDLSEEQLLERILPLLPTSAATIVGPGDDCAVVEAPDGRFVVTTDVLVEDRHFRLRWSSGEDVGWRAAMQNLADVAAMGAAPTSLVVSLVVPGNVPVSWVEGLARGFAAAGGPAGASVVGGDLSGGSGIVVAVTAHGALGGREPVLRSGARPGDVVALAGRCGWSAAGLALLDGPRSGDQSVAPGVATRDADLLAAYRRPEPPLLAGVAAARAGATSMIDVSDGLLRDAGRIASASGVRLGLDFGAFMSDVARVRCAARIVLAELDRDVGEDAEERLAREWVFAGGEDHGLLATFPSEADVPDPFRVIGHVLPSSGAPGVLLDGDVSTTLIGWDHFGG